MGKDILYETMKIVAKQRNIKASPQHDLYKKFTDKVRANSTAACEASFPRKSISFKYDGSKDGLRQLCEDILDWLEKFYRDFFKSKAA